VTIDLERIKQIRDEMNDVPVIIDIPAYPTDGVRESYLFSELDSLISITSLANNYFKESFIILRSVFEKFLYFWLMFEGTSYKWTQPYQIEPRTSSTPRQARDKTYDMWQGLKKSGDPKYAHWEIQKGHPDNVILLTFQEEGQYMTRSGIRTNEIVPICNYMLDQYEPDIKHLSDIENRVNNLIDRSDGNVTSYQNRIYNHYIYVSNIYRNLRINDLVDQFQLNIIRIHYNYLSKYVHPTKYSIQLRDRLNTRNYGTQYGEKQGLKDLILFYCVKLMQLYFQVFISGYEDTKYLDKYSKFQLLVKELDEMSKDFWFFDNKPTNFDLEYSDMIKKGKKAMGKTIPTELIYNEDPLDRLMKLSDYRG